MKACIIIPIYFGYRARHSDSPFLSIDDVVDLAKYLISHYVHLDTGMPTDVIFVNNSPSLSIATSLFDEIDNKPIKRGIFRVIQGDNIGFSFGAHNKAFQMFADEYDIWCFTEDDIIFDQDDFLLFAVDQLSDKDVGFVAAVGVSSTSSPIHAYGGVGITTRNRLRNIVNAMGELPHAHEEAILDPDKYDPQHFKRVHIIGGEIAFTSCYQAQGLKIVKLNYPQQPFIRWSENYSDTPRDIEDWGTSRFINPHK